jgi:hypothetical protein
VVERKYVLSLSFALPLFCLLQICLSIHLYPTFTFPLSHSYLYIYRSDRRLERLQDRTVDNKEEALRRRRYANIFLYRSVVFF